MYMGRNMDNLLLNLLFSFLLFFISNWFGKRSIKFGYHQLSFDSSEEQPIFNILYRSFTPVVFILVVSVFLDKINLFLFNKKYLYNNNILFLNQIYFYLNHRQIKNYKLGKIYSNSFYFYIYLIHCL